jgi:hypothetical protein
MPKLKVTITNEGNEVTGQYEIDCVNRPGSDSVAYDSAYTIDLIRVAAERHRYLADFPDAPPLSLMSATYQLDDPMRPLDLYNVNELWFEVQNLISGARLNFATARMLKELEDAHSSSSSTDLNAKFELHLEKMERFHFGVYELARIEDLIVRLVYEFFGVGFIEADLSRPGWEKRLTWDAMKDALNKRGKPERQPHPRLDAMNEIEYKRLIDLIRTYRSPKVLELTSYRDRRTHRVAPTVDHAALGVVIQSLPSGQTIPLFSPPNEAEFDFLELYSTATDVYTHLVNMLVEINSIVHA